MSPYLDLLRQGCAARLPYDKIFPKLEIHISNKAKHHVEQLFRNVLQSIGCGPSGFILGRTQIFFRPKNEKFVDFLLKIDTDAAKKLAQEASKMFYIQQRHSLWICIRFLGACKQLFFLYY